MAGQYFQLDGQSILSTPRTIPSLLPLRLMVIIDRQTIRSLNLLGRRNLHECILDLGTTDHDAEDRRRSITLRL